MKKIAVFLADGFEEIEALTVVDVTRRAGFNTDIVSIEGELVRSAHNIFVKADKLFNEEEVKDYDMIVFPGGLPGAENLANDERIKKLVNLLIFLFFHHLLNFLLLEVLLEIQSYHNLLLLLH